MYYQDPSKHHHVNVNKQMLSGHGVKQVEYKQHTITITITITITYYYYVHITTTITNADCETNNFKTRPVSSTTTTAVDLFQERSNCTRRPL